MFRIMTYSHRKENNLLGLSGGANKTVKQLDACVKNANDIWTPSTR